jgi:hypothetical protein
MTGKCAGASGPESIGDRGQSGLGGEMLEKVDGGTA